MSGENIFRMTGGEAIAVFRAGNRQPRRILVNDEQTRALQEGIGERSCPSVIDVVVTRDPSRMLPGVDARTQTKVNPGDRPA